MIESIIQFLRSFFEKCVTGCIKEAEHMIENEYHKLIDDSVMQRLQDSQINIVEESVDCTGCLKIINHE